MDYFVQTIHMCVVCVLRTDLEILVTSAHQTPLNLWNNGANTNFISLLYRSISVSAVASLLADSKSNLASGMWDNNAL